MSAESLSAAESFMRGEMGILAGGISGLGVLLATSVDNEEAGVNLDAIKSVGWMMESVGKIILTLSDTHGGIACRLQEITIAQHKGQGRAKGGAL